jgi:hypothetical protein
VDAALVSAANEQDPAARKVLLGGVRQDLAARVDEISEALRQSGWTQIGLGVVGAAVPVAVSAATGDVVTLAAALPGLGQVAYGARSRRATRRGVLGRPLAYAALARAKVA